MNAVPAQESIRPSDALSEDQAQIRAIFEHSAMSIALVDVSGRIIRCNRALEQLLGYSEADLRGKDFIQFVHPDDAPSSLASFRELMQGNRPPFQAERRVLRKNGQVIVARGTMSLWHDPGRPSFAIAMIEDITNLRQLEAALQEEVMERARAEQTTRDSEELFRQLAQTIDQVFWIVNPTTKQLIYVSPAYETIFGRTGDSLLRQPGSWLDAVHPDDRARVNRAVLTKQLLGDYDEVYRVIRPDGSARWIRDRAFPLRNAVGEVYRIIGTATDITRSKLTEDGLRKLSRAVEQSPASIIITDRGGRIEYINPKFTAVTGYSPEEVAGKTPRFLKSGEMPAQGYKQLWSTITAGKEWHGEFHNRKKNGELFWELASISPITDSEGNISHFLAIKEDITERKRAQERIREQAELLDKAHDAICIQDLSQKILYWNQGARRLYGWKVEEAVGKKADDLLFAGDSQQLLEALHHLIRTGEWHGELDQVDRNGTKLVVESHWSLMRDKSWKPHSILMINTDVTEKKQTEAKFLRTQRMESLGALAGGIAHDLNNVLAPIMMAAEVLTSETTAPDDRQMLDIIQTSARRGSEMVKQILSFARGVGSQHQPVLLKHLISDIEEFARRTFLPSIQVRKNLAKDLFLVNGDATQLHQVLLNLCVNARDAMAKGGTLTLEARNIQIDETYAGRQVCGPHVLLTVIDTGHGIPAELLGKIFEPFFTTKDIGKGTGLGLSTVVGIVKTHGGFLDVTSQQGVGTIFRVFLPAARDTTQPAEQPVAPVPAGRGELILVVDDNTAILEMLKVSLEAHNYRVLTASDGAEALRLYEPRHSAIRVVVTDMLMPTMNGMELIQALRNINPSLKAIGTTGQGSAEELARIAQPLVECFLTKPFGTQALLLKLHDVLG